VWNEARIINATANLLMVLAVLALLAGALLWVVRLPTFDIKRIVIAPTAESGFQYVSPDLCAARLPGA
jgi:cell division protein FtsQ